MTARVAHTALCEALSLPPGSVRSMMIRRPSTVGGDMGAVLNQMLGPAEAMARLPPRRIAGIARACRASDTARAVLALQEPRLAEVLSLLAGDYRSRALSRLHLFEDLLLRPSGPLQSAARLMNATGCDALLEALATKPQLRSARVRLASALRGAGLREEDLQRRLHGQPVVDDDIASSFSDVFNAAMTECRFLEDEALRIALQGSAVEATLSAHPMFVDDSVGTGETLVTVAALQAIYAGGTDARFFALGATYPRAARRWRASLKIATAAYVVAEDRPELAGGYWTYRDGLYTAAPFSSVGGIARIGGRAHREATVFSLLAAAERAGALPDASLRLVREVRAQCVQTVLVRRHLGERRGLCEVFEADLYRRVGDEPASHGHDRWTTRRALAAYLSKLDRVLANLRPDLVEEVATAALKKRCREWTRQHLELRRDQRRQIRRLVRDPAGAGMVRAYLARAPGESRFCDDDATFAALLQRPHAELRSQRLARAG